MRGFSHQIFRSFSLSFFYFFEKRGKGEREECALFLPCVFWGSDKAKEEGDFDLRETLSSSDEEKKEKKLVVCFLTVRESERVRETIIVSSAAAAAWHKVVVVVEVEMA